MTRPFDTQIDIANHAIIEDENDDAATALVAAEALIETPVDRARVLIGQAILHHRNDESELALEIVDKASALCLSLDRTNPPLNLESTTTLAEVWRAKADILSNLERKEEAAALLDLSLRRHLDLATPTAPHDKIAARVRLAVVRSLMLRADTLDSIGRQVEAIACYDELVRRFENATDHPAKARVARAILNRAERLRHTDRADEEMPSYDTLIARFSEETHWHLVETVTCALVRRTKSHWENRNFAAVLELTAATIGRCEGKTEPIAHSRLIEAELLQATGFREMGRMSEARDAYDRMTARYRNSSDPKQRKAAAAAQAEKAHTFDDLAEKIACYDAVITQFGDDPHVELKQAVAITLMRKAQALACAYRDSEAIVCFDTIIKRCRGTRDAQLMAIMKDARDFKANL